MTRTSRGPTPRQASVSAPPLADHEIQDQDPHLGLEIPSHVRDAVLRPWAAGTRMLGMRSQRLLAYSYRLPATG
eukprot:CAMPEP_0170588126 /NCGR_PEP_ID=MMETSP0224-20130122/10663_1 /TAXON_ID=285029 /ORGANISM="Togula jolla, Strain CCCM 725" /LENGTH=73 /DNA_ID=CAMNT_0010911821 /DNA_START=181 /DNA_END=400 /DNA_ORIENTATION=+